jgi:hypothetical protein
MFLFSNEIFLLSLSRRTRRGRLCSAHTRRTITKLLSEARAGSTLLRKVFTSIGGASRKNPSMWFVFRFIEGAFSELR